MRGYPHEEKSCPQNTYLKYAIESSIGQRSPVTASFGLGCHSDDYA